MPEDWIASLGHGDPAAFARATVPVSADGYANQWWRRDGRTTARGIHDQLIAVDRAARGVVTILSSWPAATDNGLDAAQRAFVTRALAR